MATVSPALLARFHARLHGRLGDGIPAPELLSPALERCVTEARRAHPGLSISPEDFADHLADRLPKDVPVLDAIGRTHAADLYLSLACARGESAALVAFDHAYGEELRKAAGREKALAADDLLQLVRQRLFAGEHPRIREYAGQGELKSWVRVTAVRVVVDASRKKREEPAGEEAASVGLPDPSDDPELAYLKRLYRKEFQAAFEAAAQDLSPEQRNVLRFHYVQGLGIDQLAAMHGVHRATAARQIQRARETLLEQTRARLAEKLRLATGELDSVMRMIESQVHLSVHRVLGENDDGREGGA